MPNHEDVAGQLAWRARFPMAKRRSKLTITVLSTVDAFSDDELMTRAAALAFYGALSFAPLLLLMVWTVSVIQPSWMEQMLAMMAGVVGSRAAGAINDIVTSARTHPQLGSVAGLIGMGITLFSASAVFAQLQGTLNRVWHVKPKPGAAIGAWLRARAHAFALLVGIGFLLIISFVVSATIQALIPGQDALWKAAEYIVSVVVFVVAFGGMYKVLPDAAIEWRDAVMGALITTLLFLLGKYAIGFYISHANVGGAYGPAAAFVVLLTWVYYSSIIVLVGAALTRAVAEARGKPIVPAEHAVEVEAKLAEVSEPGGAPTKDDPDGSWRRRE